MKLRHIMSAKNRNVININTAPITKIKGNG
jgi:hypothetical protein